ncbi:hypothetical protein BSIN_3970 [Burkholderia singularis]|uniref:Uncharacterized protein n=1 Tax=Burkholderia singularis TaxID=1503053 RepID=A0A238H6M4_9BURK|nr:hypothetical protein BSIN_3970 [Burkholderia singularis]
MGRPTVDLSRPCGVQRTQRGRPSPRPLPAAPAAPAARSRETPGQWLRAAMGVMIEKNPRVHSAAAHCRLGKRLVRLSAPRAKPGRGAPRAAKRQAMRVSAASTPTPCGDA